jgi:hypothetical protein
MTYSSSSHEGDAAHQSCSVETGAGDDGGVHEEERRQEESLGTVEGRPESVLLDVAASR